VVWGFVAFSIFVSLLSYLLIHCVKTLVSLLLNSKDNELIIHHYDETLAVWDVENENERPTIPQFQKK
jgi:poly-beta-hydroxyalkanoate depolymerase